MELLMALAPALTWWLVTNAAASMAVALAARRWLGGPASDPGRRASRLFALRMLPTTLSTAFVLAVFAPSWARFEPAGADESLGLTLVVAAAFATFVIACALTRGRRAWRAADRRERAWLTSSAPSRIAGCDAWSVGSREPAMALAGVFSPRLYIGAPVLEALTNEELSVAVRHEAGHASAFDNVKRLAMVSAPDLLAWLPVARTLERAWAVAAEQAADVAATGTCEQSRLALASAIVKVARLRLSAEVAMSALVGDGDIAARVARLLGPAPARVPAASRATRLSAWLCLAGCGIASYPALLTAVHRLTEALVRLP